ncbi:MAG: hypothetical protein ACXVRU_12730, partial [Gaiellaceae bacterium]
MDATDELDYAALAAAYGPATASWDAFVREKLEPAWIASYRSAMAWTTEVLEIPQGELVFLFDAAPTLKHAPESGDDRIVALWGRSRAPEQRRDCARLAGFLPNPLA